MSNNKSSFTLLVVIALIVVGLVKLPSYFTSSERAYKELDNYLKNKYGEEFVINYMGLRSVNDKKWYEAGIVFPKSYIGTPKENDTYYWGKGFVNVIGLKLEPGDSYGKVLLNESANNFYLPKLKELFGENVLPVLDIKGGYDYTDFQKELQVRNKLISGGIYIFGRVENDEDREKYREEIYKFLSFMKETGTFEYVDLDIMVVDERELIPNSQKLLEHLSNDLSADEWRKQRRILMKAGNKEFADMSQKEISQKINSINKGKYLEETYGVVLYTKIYSPKYIKSKGWEDEEIKEYNRVSDIKFDLELW